MQIYAGVLGRAGLAGMAGLGWAGLEGTLETMQPGIRDEMASAEADTETVWTLDTGHRTASHGHGDVVDTQLQGPGSKLLLH